MPEDRGILVEIYNNIGSFVFYMCDSRYNSSSTAVESRPALLAYIQLRIHYYDSGIRWRIETYRSLSPFCCKLTYSMIVYIRNDDVAITVDGDSSRFVEHRLFIY